MEPGRCSDLPTDFLIPRQHLGELQGDLTAAQQGWLGSLQQAGSSVENPEAGEGLDVLDLFMPHPKFAAHQVLSLISDLPLEVQRRVLVRCTPRYVQAAQAAAADTLHSVRDSKRPRTVYHGRNLRMTKGELLPILPTAATPAGNEPPHVGRRDGTTADAETVGPSSLHTRESIGQAVHPAGVLGQHDFTGLALQGLPSASAAADAGGAAAAAPGGGEGGSLFGVSGALAALQQFHGSALPSPSAQEPSAQEVGCFRSQPPAATVTIRCWKPLALFHLFIRPLIASA